MGKSGASFSLAKSENEEIQFVVRAEFDAVIADENKGRFIEVSETQAEEIKKNPKEHLVSAGKVIKRPSKPVKPLENVLLPKIDQVNILK